MIVKVRYYDERYFILVGILYYLSFFENKDIDMIIDKIPIRNR